LNCAEYGRSAYRFLQSNPRATPKHLHKSLYLLNKVHSHNHFLNTNPQTTRQIPQQTGDLPLHKQASSPLIWTETPLRQIHTGLQGAVFMAAIKAAPW
jgi:hypothetical protein